MIARMSAVKVHVVLDEELAALVREDARLRGIGASAAVRDALRAYYQVADVGDRAWREAYTAACEHLRGHFRAALALLPRQPPPDFGR
jgi:hypothetical protein